MSGLDLTLGKETRLIQIFLFEGVEAKLLFAYKIKTKKSITVNNDSRNKTKNLSVN